jgi:Xaa-Pro aminopeptidase
MIEVLKNQTGLALANALASLGTGYSEADLATAWLAALRRHSDLYHDGWYDPPPQGVIALFGEKHDNYNRMCQSSFRPPKMWPRAERRRNPETIVAAYASPVQRQSNLIGDFGLSLYGGTDPAIRKHFERVLETTLAIATQAEVGMPLCDLYQLGMRHSAAQGFANNIESSSDQTGTNIGHTIPLSYASDPTCENVKNTASFPAIREALRHGRKFVNALETQPIEPDFAITIEPRLSTATMPNTWFHLTVVFENGRRRICHGFRPVFEQAGMENLLKLLPA